MERAQRGLGAAKWGGWGRRDWAQQVRDREEREERRDERGERRVGSMC